MDPQAQYAYGYDQQVLLNALLRRYSPVMETSESLSFCDLQHFYGRLQIQPF